MHRKTKDRPRVAYIRPLPRLSEAEQLEWVRKAGVPEDKIYIEGKRLAHGERLTFADFVYSLTPGTEVCVSHLFVIADPRVPKKRRASLRDNLKAIETKGTPKSPISIWELSTGLHNDTIANRDKMRDGAHDRISGALRGDEGGRPAFKFTDEETACAAPLWFDSRLRPKEVAAQAVRDEARKRGLKRLYLISHQQLAHRLGARRLPREPFKTPK